MIKNAKGETRWNNDRPAQPRTPHETVRAVSEGTVSEAVWMALYSVYFAITSGRVNLSLANSRSLWDELGIEFNPNGQTHEKRVAHINKMIEHLTA